MQPRNGREDGRDSHSPTAQATSVNKGQICGKASLTGECRQRTQLVAQTESLTVTALAYPASNGEKDAQSKPEAANPEAEQLRGEFDGNTQSLKETGEAVRVLRVVREAAQVEALQADYRVAEGSEAALR